MEIGTTVEAGGDVDVKAMNGQGGGFGGVTQNPTRGGRSLVMNMLEVRQPIIAALNGDSVGAAGRSCETTNTVYRRLGSAAQAMGKMLTIRKAHDTVCFWVEIARFSVYSATTNLKVGLPTVPLGPPPFLARNRGP